MTRHWSTWIGYLTAAVCGGYGLLGLYWTFGGSGFPFGTGDAELAAGGADAIHISILAYVAPEVGSPIVAALGLVGAAVAVAMARGWARGPVRTILVGFGAVMAVGTCIVIQDYRPLILVAYTPILAVGKAFFGWPPQVGFGDLYLWPRVNLLVVLLCGMGWALTTVVYRRRSAGGCRDCGRGESAGANRLVRWGKTATIIAVVAPLIYCATRWAWALGFTLGMDEKVYREGQEAGLWLAGAALATLGGLGAVLTLGLIQRWGEVFPRWMPGVRGKRVPPMLAVVPATVVSILVTSAGSMYIRIAFGRGVSGDDWINNMPETLWPIWGVALFTAAMAYHQRRRRACPTCHRDSAPEPTS